MKVPGIFALFLAVGMWGTTGDGDLASKPASDHFSVYAKIILPMKSGNGSHPIVESWVAEDISELGEESELRAVTDWIRLANPEEIDTTSLWDSVVDGTVQGCPVNGHVAELTDDGKLRVELPGWGPVPCEIIKGEKLTAEIGSRGIAVVDRARSENGKEIERDYAYVAMFVGPRVSEIRQDITELAKSYSDLKLMAPEPVRVIPEFALLCVGVRKEMVEEARKTKGPHANCSVKIYMNEKASAAFKQKASYPVGAVIVKEKQMLGYKPEKGAELQGLGSGVGGIIKRAKGYDKANGDWEYFYFEDPSKIESGKMKSCIECHKKANASDFVFGDWAKSDQGDKGPYGY